MVSEQRVVIAGASGFIGEWISAEFRQRGFEVRTIGRSARSSDTVWGDSEGIARTIDGAAILINVAGKSVNCRYHDRNRDEILRSRVETTAALRRAVEASPQPPRVWLNSSTATIYRNALDRPQSESGGDIGAGFSVDVARGWEREFFAGELPDTRRVALRMSIVLGDGPATRILFTLARLGLGGPHRDGWWFPHRRYRGIGSDPSGPDDAIGHRSRGRQKFSWVHVDDVVGAIFFLLEQEDIEGPVNIAAPEVSDNRTLMRTMRRVVGMPFGLPSFRFMLEPAMAVIRSETEMVLKSRWIDAETLRDAGYEFHWPALEPALRDVYDQLRS